MKQYIALLRGINVGGRNILPMKELRTLLTDLGLCEVKTYIQSGNVIFKSSDSSIVDVCTTISSAIKNQFSFEPKVLILSLEAFLEIASANPYKEIELEPKNIHLGYLKQKATNPDLEKLNKAKKVSEEFVLTDYAFYLKAPEGIGRSKLAQNAEKCLGVDMTVRNLRTVNKIIDLCK